jgi:hypothetical protein
MSAPMAARQLPIRQAVPTATIQERAAKVASAGVTLNIGAVRQPVRTSLSEDA